MTRWIAAALLMLASTAQAFITVNEGLPTTKDAVYIGTTTPQVLLNGGTFYAGTVPNVSLAASSNVVVGADAVVIYATGTIMLNVSGSQVFIGTNTAPLASRLLVVSGKNNSSASIQVNAFSATPSAASLILITSSGTSDSPAATGDGATDQISFQGTADFFSAAGARIVATASGTWSGSNRGMGITLGTTPLGSVGIVNRLAITGGGNVGIGTTSPAGTLDVNGTICISGANCISAWPGAGAAGLASNNAFTGNNVFGASVTFNGGVFGTVNVSSTGYIPMGATNAYSNTTLSKCVVGSTLTLSTNGGNVVFILSDSLVIMANFGKDAALGVLVDGQFVDGENATTGFSVNGTQSDAVGRLEHMSLYHRTVTAPSAGSHSYCLAIATDDTATFPMTNGAFSYKPQFTVREDK